MQIAKQEGHLEEVQTEEQEVRLHTGSRVKAESPLSLLCSGQEDHQRSDQNLRMIEEGTWKDRIQMNLRLTGAFSLDLWCSSLTCRFDACLPFFMCLCINFS